MKNANQSTNPVDMVTGFAMKQCSRRGLFKWLGKGGLVLAGITGGIGIDLADLHTSFAASGPDRPSPPPDCMGLCVCGHSDCITTGQSQSCVGKCSDPLCCFYAHITWFFAGTRYIPEKSCVACEC